MAKLLIVYGTREGHTRVVALRIGFIARKAGHAAEVIAAELRPPPAGHDAVVVAAPVHRLRHPPEVIHWVREHREALEGLPTAFFSVSLSAAFPGPEPREEPEAYVDDFVRETAWSPAMARAVAGALAYTRYGWLTRWGMRRAARKHGLSTDTSRDHDYTDWDRLRADVETFLELVPDAVPETAPAGRFPA